MRRTSWVFALLMLVGLVTVAPADAATSKVRTTHQVIGRSIEGRAIIAYHRYRVGDTTAHTAVIIGQLHGNETAGRTVAWQALKATLPAHLDLWIIVSANPDGFAHHRRQNAHGVDINRNFPRNWRHTAKGGSNYSGPSAGSERETRVLMTFLAKVDPWTIVSIHQPLNGIDAYHAKRKPLAKALSHATLLPIRTFDCHGGCYGTMTQWFNHGHDGAAITMELPSRPTAAFIHHTTSGTLTVLAKGT